MIWGSDALPVEHEIAVQCSGLWNKYYLWVA